jgi:hypothetical protein
MSKPETQNEIEKAREQLELLKIIKEMYSTMLEIVDMQHKLMERIAGAQAVRTEGVAAAKRAKRGSVPKLVLSVMTPGKEYTARDIWNILKNTSVSVSPSSVYGALRKLYMSKAIMKVRRGVYVRPK